MPASGFDVYNMQDARNNFDAMRPTPICTDANQFMGQCQNIHISTNCYYGYHDAKPPQNVESAPDCEMVEAARDDANSPLQSNGRKRSANDDDYHQIKRSRSDDSPKCSLVGTRSSPSHSASAFNTNTSNCYVLHLTYRFILSVTT